jgi:hypothetical protein
MENPGIKKALTIEQAFWQSKNERRLYELQETRHRGTVLEGFNWKFCT